MIRITKYELGRYITMWSVVGLLIFLIFGAVIHQIGIEKVKIENRQQVEFINNEMQKIKRYVNVRMYGAYGIRRLLKSSPLFSLFFNSSPVTELQAFIDVGVRLELSKPEIGKCLFDRSIGGVLDYSWYVSVIGSIVVLVMGFFALRNKNHLRFLMNFAGTKSVYMGVILSRILFILISMILTVSLTYIQYLVNGITLTGAELPGLLIFLLLSVTALVFLLTVSAAFGASENWLKWGIITFVFWFVMVFLWPEIINVIFSGKASANMKSFYSHESKKVEKLMKFEKKAYEKVTTGRYKSEKEKIESDRDEGEKWYNEHFEEIEEIENEMIGQAEDISRDFQFWCSFSPITFYRSANNEIGSRGFNSYVIFYKENLKEQKGFLRFYLDKRFYENYSKFESYLPASKIVTTAKTGLPGFFAVGLIISILYIVASLFFAYFRFKKYLFPPPEKIKGSDNVKIDLRTGNYITINIFEKDFSDRLFNVLHGQPKGTDVKISIDGETITADKKIDFFYLPNPDKLAGAIKIRCFLSNLGCLLRLPKEKIRGLKEEFGKLLNRRYNELTKLEKAGLLFRAARLTHIKAYIFHDFLKDIYDSHRLQLVKQIDDLKIDEVLIVDILTGAGVNAPSPDCHMSITYEDTGYSQSINKGYDD